MASRSFKHFVEQKLGKFPQIVIYMLLEWVLIILLFIDGFLAFFSNEFAKFFELKAPCLLCTRIDHVLLHRNSNSYYNDSICEVHKRELSSLAYCHVHRKLSDIRSMCEPCLLSFAKEKDSDTDTYKPLVGILHNDINSFLEDDQMISLKSPAGRNKDDAMQVEKNQNGAKCSCCGEPLKRRPSSKSVALGSSLNATLLSQLPAPSPRAPTVTFKDESELTQIRYMEPKSMLDHESALLEVGNGSNLDNQSCKRHKKTFSAPLLPEPEDLTEDAKTPNFIKTSKFFGSPLADLASNSPRWASRIPRKLQLEKSESNEAEGDSILHRLKKQVHLDRKSLVALYMELDEERSASAVAANNAMAMITRLQAEKAAIQMEALQYQRMMEEEAEYDQEALQTMKDLLDKREEDIKVLEAELEAYKVKNGNVRRKDSEDCKVDADEDHRELKSQSLSSPSQKSYCGNPSGVDCSGESDRNNNGERTFDESSLDFEDERSHRLGLLTNLEKKISLSSDNEIIYPDPDSNTVTGEDQHKGNDYKAILRKEVADIKESLRAIEADSGFLKHAAITLHKGAEGTKLLTEVALHLRKLRLSLKVPLEDVEA